MKETIYKDYIYDGSRDSQGILVVNGAQAIENALRLWLVSFKGDVIRHPNYGGYLTRWLFKPLTQENADDMRLAIQVGLEAEFRPKITLTKLSVTPDIDRECWVVEMEGYVAAINENISIIENLRKQV